MSCKSLLLACFTLVPFVALASDYGPSTGGGGDARCQEYSNLLGAMAKGLARVGADEIQRVNPMIQLNEVISVVRTHKCLPTTELDRQARSNPDTVQTDLLADAWEKLWFPQKLRLAAHELAVLARYERDGEYYMSEDIVGLAKKGNPDLIERTRAEKVVKNLDGTTTFLRPFVDVDNKRSFFGAPKTTGVVLFLGIIPIDKKANGGNLSTQQATGICRNLGYQSADSWLVGDESIDNYAEVNESGALVGYRDANNGIKLEDTVIVFTAVSKGSVRMLESITCRK